MRRPYALQTASRASTDPHTALKEKLEFAPYRFIADEYNSGNRVIEMQSTAVADEISREDWLGLPLNREATGEGLSVLYLPNWPRPAVKHVSVPPRRQRSRLVRARTRALSGEGALYDGVSAGHSDGEVHQPGRYRFAMSTITHLNGFEQTVRYSSHRRSRCWSCCISACRAKTPSHRLSPLGSGCAAAPTSSTACSSRPAALPCGCRTW
jgi:hypothetical protein